MNKEDNSREKKTVFCVPYTDPQRPQHTPEEIELMQDHIDNWNPGAHALDQIKKGNFVKACELFKKSMFPGLI